jgi:hypothetical protein
MNRKTLIKAGVIVFWLLVVSVCLAVTGVRPVNRRGMEVDPGQVHTGQYGWHEVGSFAAAGDEPDTPTTTQRDQTTLEALSKVETYTIPSYWNAVVIRCESTTDGDSTVFDMFIRRDNTDDVTDIYTRIGTLTFTTGTSEGYTTNYEMADTLAITNEYWGNDLMEVSPTGNYVAELWVDLAGVREVAFVPTTITNNAKLFITGY